MACVIIFLPKLDKMSARRENCSGPVNFKFHSLPLQAIRHNNRYKSNELQVTKTTSPINVSLSPPPTPDLTHQLLPCCNHRLPKSTTTTGGSDGDKLCALSDTALPSHPFVGKGSTNQQKTFHHHPTQARARFGCKTIL